MPQLVKMTQRQLRGPAVVQQNVGDAFNLAVTGDRDHWDGKTVLQRRIDGDEALDRAVHQQSRILLDQVCLAPMAGGQVEIPLFEQHLFDAVHHQYRITVAQLRYQHPH
jgi:hypothetical protein